MAAKRKPAEPSPQQRPPATTLKGREDQLIDLAVAEAERQLLSRTASSQVITHYLKLGTTRELLEQERLRNENLLLEQKRKSMESAQRSEELFAEALKAMREYKGQEHES